MNLEDLKTYLAYAGKAMTILSRRIDPLGTEYDVLKDVVAEIRRIKYTERDIEIPGIKRAWELGIIQGATAMFREKVKKDIMPAAFAKADNLVIEPVYRPKIFNMTEFKVSWSGVTPPAVVDLLTPGGTPGTYELQTDKEIIILTDLVFVDGTPITELKITVDGEELKPVVTRKDFTLGNVKVYELPFPVVADISLRLQGRVETASGTFTYLPIGVHVALGSIHAGLT